MSQDLWCTPPELFNAINEEFNFGLDAAASDINALCDDYITEDMDAFSTPWLPQKDGRSIWCNPPYSRAGGGLLNWVLRGADQSKRYGINVVMLVPPSMCTRYMAYAHRYASEIRFFETRLSFVHPETNKPVKGNRYDSCLIIFRGTAPDFGSARTGYISDPCRGDK